MLFRSEVARVPFGLAPRLKEEPLGLERGHQRLDLLGDDAQVQGAPGRLNALEERDPVGHRLARDLLAGDPLNRVDSRKQGYNSLS